MSVESSTFSPAGRDSAPKGAVFLSYASQDADAARRIADSLRAAGIEVWFDQSELVGGDAWDQKIRKQIKDCALLTPIISAATQARTEGYFRLEWRLADQRTHLMAKGRPFLLPVVIDDTRDADAHVPDSFTEVQWTRLRQGYGGQALDDANVAAFCARVKKLLGGTVAGVARAELVEEGDPGPASPRPATTKPARSHPWLLPAILGLAAVVAALAVWQPWRGTPSPPPTIVSPAATEIGRVRARIIPDRWQREDFDAVSATLDRLIKGNPEESDAWALRSIINSLQVVRNFDAGTKPLETGKSDADRALRLGPGSPLAEIAFGLHLVAMTSRGGDAAACRPYIDRGVAALPPDALTRYVDLVSRWFGYEFEDVRRVAEAWLAAEPQASFPAWILSQSYFVQRQPDEAEQWAEQAMVDSGITGVRAYYTRFESKYYLRADLRAARQALEKFPPAGRSVHRVIHARWLVAMAEHRWDEALQELAKLPEPFLFDRSYRGPKALLAGLAHQRAGRTEAAATQFREAERLLREHLAADPDNEELHGVLAVTLACAGRGDEARSELALVEPLVKGRAPTLQRGSLALPIAQTYGILGDSGNLALWLRLLLEEPSQFAFTPAALRLDPRFAGAVDAPEVQALLKEFASLDQMPAHVAVDQKSIAVLAFANLSDDKGNEYFSDGISEELLNVLAKVPGLKVTARTSAFFFKGKQVPLAEIAQQLGVAYVVEGSVRKSGDRVRITAQLIKAADGFNVWSDTFTRDLKDIFAVQDEIAGLVAQQLQLTLGDAPRVAKTVNPEAHRLVLEGRFFWNQRNDVAFERAEAAYQHALALDPEFAEAHAGLADVWAVRGWYRIMVGNAVQAEADFERAKDKVRRAQALNPALAEPYATLGVVLMNQRKFAESEGQFAQAIALNPNYAVAWHWHAGLLISEGRVDEAVREIERSLSLDPLSPNTLWAKATYFRAAGRVPEALDAAERALALRPGHPTILSEQALALWELGRRDEAITVARAIGRDLAAQPRWLADPHAIYVLRLAGLQTEAEAYAGRVLVNVPTDDYRHATTLVALGRGKEALFNLRTLPNSAATSLYFNPMWDALRDDPLFQQWLVQIGCAAEYKVARETQARMLQEREAKK